MPITLSHRFCLLVTGSIVVAAAPTLAAQARGSASARDTDDAIGKPGALTIVEAAVLSAMSDRNIVAHLMLEDSTEASLAQPVSEIVRDTAVSSFAKMLATDHARSLELDRALVPGLRGLPQLSSADSTDPRTLRMMALRFRGLGPDTALGPTFVSAELVHHLHVLNELGALRATAMQAPVQRRIDDAMAVERSHVARARRLAHTLGLPSP